MKKRLFRTCCMLLITTFGFLQTNAQFLADAASKSQSLASASRDLSSTSRLNVYSYNGETKLTATPIKGTIKSEKGEPLIGASVVVKGTTTGTVVDENGNFELAVPDGTAVLVISFVGYDTQEITVGNQTTINVILTEGKALGEVVVIGYGTVKKSDITGSISSITTKELEKIPATNIVQAMQGQAAGVDIAQTDARPGAAPQVRIRGNRSLNATNNPLYVMDGIPMSDGSNINDFNPLDIESIEVLKDASATAIYGSRGANGVILISSKKAKKGKTTISYSGSVGISSPLVPFNPLGAADFAEVRRDGKRNNATTAYNSAFADPELDYQNFNTDLNMWESVSQGYTWIDKNNRIAQKRPATADEKARMAAFQAFNPKSLITDSIAIYDPTKVRNTNWSDYALQQGKEQNHQLSITGGTDKLSVSFSLGYLDKQGLQPGQGYQRYSSRVGLDWSVNDWLRLGASANVNLTTQQFGTDIYSNAVFQLPVAIPYDPTSGAVISQPGGDALIYTPLNSAAGEIDDRRTNRYFGSLFAEVQLMKGLKYRANVGPDATTYRRGQFQSSNSNARRGGTTFGYYQNDQRLNFVLENLLYYNTTIAKKHDIGVTLLQSIQQDRFENISLSVQDLPYNSQLFYNLGSTNATGPDAFGSNYTLVKMMSFMGRVNYAYNNKYLLTASIRRDGSSVLSEGNKWDVFPSFAAAWKISEESFLKDSRVINQLKLRVGYGRTGNSAINPYTTTGGLLKTRYAWDNAAAWGYVPNLIANPDLKWETTDQVDVGLDFSLFGDRVTGVVDLYRANTSNLLMDRQIPTASGFNSVQANVGATRNTGIEISLNTVNVHLQNSLKWTSSIIFSSNKEEITSLYGGTTDDIANRWFIGQPIVSYYDYVPQGVWTTAEAAQAAEYGSKPGLAKFLDINGDKKIDANNDRKVIGSNVPKWTGSLSNTFSYKGVDLSFMLYARIGQTILNGYLRPYLTGRYTENSTVANNYWTPTNQTGVLYPKINADQERPLFPESYLYTDGSFVKLRNVTLGYSIPSTVLPKIGLKNLYLYVTGQNLFVWSPFKVTDPEFTNTTRDPTSTVNTFNNQVFGINLTERMFVFGVRAGL